MWAETIKQTRAMNPNCYIEVLTPDMQGNKKIIDKVLDAKPHVFNHNFETIPRLQKEVRGRANLKDSTQILERAKERNFITKTSFMLGMGETQDEMEEMILYCANFKNRYYYLRSIFNAQ